jgi:hypothetical protein
MTHYCAAMLCYLQADKQDNTVSAAVMAATVAALREAGVRNTPIVITSSETKLGRDAMWRYLRLAALGNNSTSSAALEHAYGRDTEATNDCDD